MATLRDEAVQELHRQFLQNAKEFRFVRCAAIRHEDASKPLLHEEWCGLLGGAYRASERSAGTSPFWSTGSWGRPVVTTPSGSRRQIYRP